MKHTTITNTPTHPTLRRYMAALEGISSAKTPKGVLAAVKTHRVKSPGPDSLRPRFILVPVKDTVLAKTAYEEVKRMNPRKKNIYYGEPLTDHPNEGMFSIPRWETFRYKGKFSRFKGSEIYADYCSYIRFTSDGRTARLIQSGVEGLLHPAPAGMKWDSDVNGVKLVRLSDGMDYHPTLDDYRAKDFAARVRRAMAQNYLARKASMKAAKDAARHDEVFRRESTTCRVLLEDSRRAGNCIEGTLRFAERSLGLDRSEVLAGRHLIGVPASRLRACAGSDAPRVDAAIRQAWMRETMVSI